MSRPLNNHLRTYRRSRGLTQLELAFLFGHQSASNVSRVERGDRPIALPTMFACQLIFGTEARVIYSGLFEQVHERVLSRIEHLRERVSAQRPTARSRAKLKLLDDALARARALGTTYDP